MPDGMISCDDHMDLGQLPADLWANHARVTNHPAHRHARPAALHSEAQLLDAFEAFASFIKRANQRYGRRPRPPSPLLAGWQDRSRRWQARRSSPAGLAIFMPCSKSSQLL